MRRSARASALTITFLLTLGATFVAGATLAAPPSGPAADLSQPTTVDYEGRLGRPDGLYDLRFRIFDASTGGALASPTVVTVPSVAIHSSEFRVALDFGNVFRGSARFLEISYRNHTTDLSTPYTVAAGRRALNAVPYALGLRPGAVMNGGTGAGGVLFNVTNSGGNAISGHSGSSSDSAVYGTNVHGDGIKGVTTDGHGVVGESNGSGTGVLGTSAGFDGVHGQSSSAVHAGVAGINTNNGFGVYAQSGNGTALQANASGTGWAVYGGSVGNDGVVGETQSSSKSGVVGFNQHGGNGVYGESHSALASGVYGHNSGSGYGVAGRSDTGTGVLGDSTNGWAIKSAGNTTQSRDKGGFVKAMIRVGPNGSILACFNSQIAPANATSVPCGFTVEHTATGLYKVDFGFRVNDRFALVTVEYYTGRVGGSLGRRDNAGLTQDQDWVHTFFTQTASVQTSGDTDLGFVIVVY